MKNCAILLEYHKINIFPFHPADRILDGWNGQDGRALLGKFQEGDLPESPIGIRPSDQERPGYRQQEAG